MNRRLLMLCLCLPLLASCAAAGPDRSAGEASLMARLSNADAAYEAGRWGEARTGYAAVLERDPDNPRALFRLGVLVYRDGDLDRAERLFRKARTTTDRPHLPATHNLAVLHLRLAYELFGQYLELAEQESGSRNLGPPPEENRLEAMRELRAAIEAFREDGLTR